MDLRRKKDMSGLTIDQDFIDLYYENKKKEAGEWITEYTANLKRLEDDQRKRLLRYAKTINFENAGELNAYAQSIPTISKKNKQKLTKYLQQIDWLPDGITVGFLDGQLVVKMLPNTLAEDMIRAAFGPEEPEEGDSNSDN